MTVMSERAERKEMLSRDSQGKLHLDCQDSRPVAYLVIEDGTVLKGRAFGACDSGIPSMGELVFNTSLSGYQEILTDPSYAGQIITLTYPEVGNYGVNADDMESKKIYARGLVVRNLSHIHSNHLATHSLDEFLKTHGIIGISDVDTRLITRKIRDKGALRCLIAVADQAGDLEKLKAQVQKIPGMTGQNLTEEVSTEKSYVYPAKAKAETEAGAGAEAGSQSGNKSGTNPGAKSGTNSGRTYKVAVMDFGCKENILRELTRRGIEATVYPALTKAKDILATKPDGIFLSNGPGDPAACTDVLAQLPALIESRIPIFGICLGHQLLSIALGAKTYKLKFGHRGGNQPVKDLTTGKVEITSQNHGFAVADDSLPDHLELTHINLNDGSVEGFRHKTLPIFAVQYHPESSPGPHDSSYLFDRFIKMMAATGIKSSL